MPEARRDRLSAEDARGHAKWSAGILDMSVISYFIAGRLSVGSTRSSLRLQLNELIESPDNGMVTSMYM